MKHVITVVFVLGFSLALLSCARLVDGVGQTPANNRIQMNKRPGIFPGPFSFCAPAWLLLGVLSRHSASVGVRGAHCGAMFYCYFNATSNVPPRTLCVCPSTPIPSKSNVPETTLLVTSNTVSVTVPECMLSVWQAHDRSSRC